MTKRDEILNHTREFLKSQNAISKEVTKNSPVIYQALKSKIAELNENTVNAYLSSFSKDPTSGILLAGKRQGYYYVEPDQNVVSISNSPRIESNTRTETRKRTEREKRLYPIVQEWLKGRGYRVKDTSSMRGNDKWGNPDITGLKVIETVSETKDVELVTIEVKATIDNWRDMIFEAVSHTRFANQVYFCFAYSEDYQQKIESEMSLYAEEFGIGILGIEMTEEDYQNFVTRDYKPEFNDVFITEIRTPPFKILRPYFREKFFRMLEVNKLSDLYTFGEAFDDMEEAS